MTITGKAGMAWYRQKDYPSLRILFVDGDSFLESYDDWHNGAKEAERRAIAWGVEIVRITIEPAAFSAWCKLQALRPDATARRRYVRHGTLLW